MIRYAAGEAAGSALPPRGYIEGRGLAGRLVLPLTRWLRAVHAERYIGAGERLLDIGCGDGYFLRRQRMTERIGLDKRLGDEVTDRLDFPDDHFDYVTMLAVIEHIAEPGPIVAEIHRVLKPGGRFVFTTPKRSAEVLIRLYARDIEEEHETYFDLARVRALAGERFELTGHHSFILGLNQAFCLTALK
jgi:SAM-dependent methyltransferase